MSIPDDIHSNMIDHMVTLTRLESGERRRIRAMLRRLQSELAADIVDSGLDTSRTDWQRSRLRDLQQLVERKIAETYSTIGEDADIRLRGIAEWAADGAVAAVNNALGVDALARLDWTPAQLRKLADSTLVEGAPSAEWWSRQVPVVRDSFMDEMRMGTLRGETLPDLTRRAQDVLGVASRRAEAITRTSVISVANSAHLAAFEENADIIASIQWVSTLDNRTTPICRALDGLQWSIPDHEPLGHDRTFPGPTAHWNCRSTQVPVTKTWEQLATKNKALARKLDEAMTPGKRASMGGPVGADLTYQDWFKGLPRTRQEEILGPARMSLWERGKLGFRDMVDQTGNPLTLEELRER